MTEERLLHGRTKVASENAFSITFHAFIMIRRGSTCIFEAAEGAYPKQESFAPLAATMPAMWVRADLRIGIFLARIGTGASDRREIRVIGHGWMGSRFLVVPSPKPCLDVGAVVPGSILSWLRCAFAAFPGSRDLIRTLSSVGPFCQPYDKVTACEPGMKNIEEDVGAVGGYEVDREADCEVDHEAEGEEDG